MTRSLESAKEKRRKYTQHRDKGKDFLNGTLAAKEIRPRIDEWYLIKLKGFFTAKKTVKPDEEADYKTKENLCQPTPAIKD